MKKAIKVLSVIALGISCLFTVKVHADGNPTFGTAYIYGPKTQYSYPQAGDSYELKPGTTITLSDDGDLEYECIYELNQSEFRELIVAGLSASDAPEIQLIAPFLPYMETALLFSTLFNRTKNSSGYSTYAGLLDKHQYEFVVKIDDGLKLKQNSSGEYEFTYQSDYLEPILNKVTYNSETKEFVVPCKIKDSAKFSSKGPDYAVADIQAILDALGEMTLTATVTFGDEDNYNNIKNTKGKTYSTGYIRVILPNEIFPEHNPGAGSWMRESYIATFGEDAILTEGEGNSKRHYLQIQPDGGVTTLLAPEPVIRTTNQYASHTDGKAIFWLANDGTSTLDIVYDIYNDREHTIKANADTEVVWSVEMVGGFENYNFDAQMEAFFPSTSRNTTWDAENENNKVSVQSIKSGIYKVSVTIEGNSDYCYVVVPGDVNRDAHIQANDASIVLRYSGNINPPINDGFTKALSDMNNDGYIQANDASMILRTSLGG